VIGLLSVAHLFEPLLTASVLYRSGLFWHVTRQLLCSAAVALVAVWALQETYASSMSFGKWVDCSLIVM
jgi:hypothetical protein